MALFHHARARASASAQVSTPFFLFSTAEICSSSWCLKTRAEDGPNNVSGQTMFFFFFFGGVEKESQLVLFLDPAASPDAGAFGRLTVFFWFLFCTRLFVHPHVHTWPPSEK